MTIEKLLELPVEDLEKMSDDELAAVLAPFFPLTRPRGEVSALTAILEKSDVMREILEKKRIEEEQSAVKLW